VADDTITSVRPLTTEDLWRELGDALGGYIRHRIADPHQADDVLSDVLVRIHQHLGTLNDRERATSWMFRVARNAIIDHYRRSAHRPEEPTADVSEVASREGPADAWLDDQTSTLAELAACIRPFVDALPDKYGRAIELTDLGGHTQVEAAILEGISVSGMKSRVQRGRRLFAAQLHRSCVVTLDRTGQIIDFHPRPDADCDPT